jgi:thioredoxin-related protein
MTMTRRQFTALAASAAALPLMQAGPTLAESEPAKADSGLYTQEWFLDSFLNMKDDLVEAGEAGKHFAVIWEQNGCPYCRETHKVNFARAEIRDYIKANFNMLQLDLWGPRKVTDFDGKEMSEQKLGRRWGVNFTPTVIFFAKATQIAPGKSARDLEVARMPGYFKPFHFLRMFEYVRSGSYEKMPFQRFIQARAEELRKQGQKIELW